MTSLSAAFDLDFLNFEQISPSPGEAAPAVEAIRCHPVEVAQGLTFLFVDHGARARNPLPVELFKSGTEGLHIEETGGGSVPVLVAHNKTDRDYLLIAGQMFVGGKQNRGLNTDVLVSAGGSTELFVTCVEQGRWSGDPRARFRHAGIEPITVRSSKHRDVGDSLRSGRAAHAQQHRVWQSVHEMSRGWGAQNASSDLVQSMRQRASALRRDLDSALAEGSAQLEAAPGHDARAEQRIEELREMLQALMREMAQASQSTHPEATEHLIALQRRQTSILRDLRRHQLAVERLRAAAKSGRTRRVSPESIARADAAATDATGMLVFFDDEFVAGDLFANQQWFRALYHDLRESALLSWAHLADRGIEARAEPGARRDLCNSARAIVRDAMRGDWTARATPGHGRSFTLEHPYLEGSVLCRNRTPLHLLVGARELPSVLRTTTARDERDGDGQPPHRL